MIYKKDDGDGKVFWKAATADRVILPNGEEAERTGYEPTGWYLLSADGEYLPYPVEEIEFVENLDNVSHPPHYADGWSNGAEVIDERERS